ncbi:MAG: response regulator, partial [Betaproteobacteria bacterium]|nr:response regulator [Betaproteobacteria bacterium]
MMGATSLTILNVSADASEREALTRALGEAGFDVWETASADEALRLAAQAPDLILLDLASPRMPMFEVCCRLKETAATAMIPVLYLGHASAADKLSARTVRANLADRYLDRPIRPPEVVEAARGLLRRTQQSEPLGQQFFETAPDA